MNTIRFVRKVILQHWWTVDPSMALNIFFSRIIAGGNGTQFTDGNAGVSHTAALAVQTTMKMSVGYENRITAAACSFISLEASLHGK